jgi:hypothetical protein
MPVTEVAGGGTVFYLGKLLGSPEGRRELEVASLRPGRQQRQAYPIDAIGVKRRGKITFTRGTP